MSNTLSKDANKSFLTVFVQIDDARPHHRLAANDFFQLQRFLIFQTKLLKFVTDTFKDFISLREIASKPLKSIQVYLTRRQTHHSEKCPDLLILESVIDQLLT